MSKAWSSPKTDVANVIKDGAGKETVEVAEAIKALQSQLADLRKIIQAAKPSDEIVIEPRHRQ